MLKLSDELLISYLSPLNGLPQQSHHILSLAVCRLEAFGPCHQDALHIYRHNRKRSRFEEDVRISLSGLVPKRSSWGFLLQLVRSVCHQQTHFQTLLVSF